MPGRFQAVLTFGFTGPYAVERILLTQFQSMKRQVHSQERQGYDMGEKIVGILGGMGPLSTVDLFLKIITSTPIRKEQDHLRIIIDNNPKIPDRTQAILGRGKDPFQELKKTAWNLEKLGAEIIAIPCNTAHYYYNDLQKVVNVPIINMILETVEYIRREFVDVKKIGLLATIGTIKARIYQDMLSDMEIIIPDVESEKLLMDLIYGERGIKAGYTTGKLRKKILTIVELLLKQGAEAIIMGCTEISLILRQKDLSVRLINPLQILAEATVRKAKYDQKTTFKE